MISIKDLVVQRDKKTVLHQLNLEINTGSVYALMGGNGAGKTTTINTLLGFIKPSSGDIQIDGVHLKEGKSLRSLIAYLPENVALYPYLTGLQNFQYFCTLAKINVSDREALQMLSDAGLDERHHARHAGLYSKGMRQKVGLAIAYAKHAKVMLLDEPTSGLDLAAANDFAVQIKNAAMRGMAILMATHDLQNARQVADRAGIMQNGYLVDEFRMADVGADELAQKYLHFSQSAP